MARETWKQTVDSGGRKKLVAYFQSLRESEGARWHRQLLMAQLWLLAVTSSEEVLRHEFSALAEELRSNVDLSGAYDELVYLIGQLAQPSNGDERTA